MLTAAACPATAGAETRAGTKLKQKEAERVKLREAEQARKLPFGTIPRGPLQIVISIDQQRLHLYSDGTPVAEAPVATGVAGHPTPRGVFSVIQKDRFHRSNIYSAAPMPYMQRITWSGVALHEGGNLGHPASHGCIRMSHDFATRLWALTRLGARVIIAGPELRPIDFADPHLFVHKEKPVEPEMPLVAAVEPVKTAQTGTDGKDGKATDATPAAAMPTADPPATTTAQSAAPGAAATPPAPGVFKTAVAVPDSGPAPMSPPIFKPVDIAHASRAPIAIFVSRKDKRIYVRQDFLPLFDAPIAVEQPERRLGTHVFTAMEYLADHTSFRWTVVSLPDEKIKAAGNLDDNRRSVRAGRRNERVEKLPAIVLPQTPAQALARLDIPREVADQISQLIVPGSSLTISDQGLGDETGEGTDFIVVMQ